jgi:hypothetical protein
MRIWPCRLGESQMRQKRMVTGSARLGPLSDYTANCRPVPSSERAPHRNKTATFRQEVISGRKSHKGARYQDILTRKVTSNFEQKLMAVRPTIIQLTNCSFTIVTYLRHNLLHKPELTGNFRTPCINVA